MISFIFINSIISHAYLGYPPPRGYKERRLAHCARYNCKSTCDSPKSQAHYGKPWVKNVKVKRGQELDVSWSRQNHPGGMVQIAITNFENSDDQKSFNNNIILHTCFEMNCKEDSPSKDLGYLNGLGKGICSTKIKIPNYFKDGAITLQWIWYAGGVANGNKKGVFAEYVNCSDLTLKGGEPYKPKGYNTKPIFKGGDIANKGKNVCRYWGSNKIGGCPEGYEGKNKGGCGISEMKVGKPFGY